MTGVPVQAAPSESVVAAPDAAPPPSKRRSVGSALRFLRNGKAITGLIILGFFVIVAIIGPWVAPYGPSATSANVLAPPSADHWLGTTHIGADVFSQLVVGTRTVLLVGFVAGGVATALAVLVGVSAGFLGGVADEVLSALSNIFLVIPALPLIIIVTSQLPSVGGLTVALVIGATAWAWGARVLRAQTLSLRRRDFVEAARANGESTWRIVWFETLPNLTAIIAASFVGTVTFAVLSLITLAFVGVIPTHEWNWGTILFWAQSNQALARGAWWWFVPAGLCIALVGTALTLINFGIDEFVNPRLRSVGVSRRSMRQRRILPRIGFTPVVRHAPRRLGWEPERGGPDVGRPDQSRGSVARIAPDRNPRKQAGRTPSRPEEGERS